MLKFGLHYFSPEESEKFCGLVQTGWVLVASDTKASEDGLPRMIEAHFHKRPNKNQLRIAKRQARKYWKKTYGS